MKFFSLLLFLLFALRLIVPAQTSFSVSDTLLQIDKNNNYTFTYAPVDVYNETEDSLRLGWELVKKEGFPEGWDFALQDPENYYRNAIPESAAFGLDTVYDYTDKFIPQMFMNGIAGQGTMLFKLYNLEEPTDSVWIRFEVQVRDVLALEENKKESGNLLVFPQPAKRGHSIFFKGYNVSENTKLKLFSLSGNYVATLKVQNGDVKLPKNLTPAYYLLVVEREAYLPLRELILVD